MPNLEPTDNDSLPTEQMHELLKVSDPKGWIGLTGIAILLGLGLFWLFFGKIPTKVEGLGLLINTGGLQSVVANISGRVDKFEIKIGDVIKKGDPVAQVAQLDLLNQIYNARKKVSEQEISNNEKLQIRKDLKVKYEDQVNTLKKRMSIQENLYKSGVVSEAEVFEVKEKLTSVQKSIEDLKIETTQDENALNALKREVDSLQERYARDAVVHSPYDGVVIEIEETVGNVITPGTRLFTLQSSEEQLGNLEGVFYISAFDGKKVKSDMRVLVIPTNIKQEEYGAMIGKVRSVSLYPATVRGMMRYLKNDEIVRMLTAKGSQVEVNVDFMIDKHTLSQYQWTSKEGPPFKIQAGTLANCKITVREKRPIELIMPKIREIFGIEE